MEEVLYSMLIGALSTIFVFIIICVPKFIIKKILKNSDEREETNPDIHTITFYNNFFNQHEKEWVNTSQQNNDIYKVDTFSGTYPAEPEPPVNEGYVFLGWYLNPECTNRFLFGQDEVNSDVNLYAKWRKSE